MRRPSKSINRIIMLHAGVPLMLTVILVVGWLMAVKVYAYMDERTARIEAVNQLIWQLKSVPGESFTQYESIRRERLEELNRRFYQEMTVAVSLMLLGITVPVVVSRYVSHLVKANLSHLQRNMTSDAAGAASVPPEHLNIKEFSGIFSGLRKALLDRAESELRWKRAEKELQSINANLLRRTEELRNGRKVAMSIMEDAESARADLEVINLRLKEVIEQARSSAREAGLANEAKSRFLATMSHELRTPLNGVIGFIDLLNQTDLNEEQKEFVDSLRISGSTLMSLINDILDFSKIESGYLDLECTPFSLTRLLGDSVSMFEIQAMQKDVKLSLEIDDAVPRHLIGDEVRIGQIINNLLSNAVKFTESGLISLKANCEHRWNPNEDCEIVFEVSDTGIGISEDHLEKLFDPFLQADSSTTRKYGGTGLGLAICKRLAEAMGGRIDATSKLGRGSSFFAYVPVKVRGHKETAVSKDGKEAIPTETNNDAVFDSSAPLATLKIAVAEDNEANQRLLGIMFEQLNSIKPSFLANGRELIEHLLENDCDIIFMDLQMPIMDGIKACELIRAGEAGEAHKDVRIIALTANAFAGDEERCLAAGMSAYLSKPFKIETLEAILRDTLEPSG